jgi:dipeptidase D
LVYVLKKYKASDVYRDDANNVIAHFPSNSSSLSHHKTITLHSHIDMVPARGTGSKHNFLKDPIKLVRRGDFIYADNTTLGADDGIGVAMILEIISNKSIKHGPLEVIFTADEETGLVGAKKLDQSKLHGKYLFSLDGYEATRPIINSACVFRQFLEIPVTMSNAIFEDILEDIETEGKTRLNRVIDLGKQLFSKTINLRQTKNANIVALKLNISGLLGGHSAINCNDDHRIKGAIKELFYILFEISKKINFAFLEIKGGDTPTSIPTSCHATILVKKSNADIVHKIFNEKARELKQLYPLETSAYFSVSEAEITSSHICLNDTKKIINLVNCLHNGLTDFDTEFKVVSGASNVGVINFDGKAVHVTLNQRNMSNCINDRSLSRVESLAKLLDIKYSYTQGATA